MRALLIPNDGTAPIELTKDVTLIGRRRTCDIRLDHPSISKVHLAVVKTDGVLFFRDLGSTNGTKVNGQRVCRGALLPNDQLSIAVCKFKVSLAGDANLNGNGNGKKRESDRTEMMSLEDFEPHEQPVRRVIKPNGKKANPRATVRHDPEIVQELIETEREDDETPNDEPDDLTHHQGSADDSGVLPII